MTLGNMHDKEEMGCHPNRESIKRAYDAYGRSDIATVLSILDNKIQWHVPGQSPPSGDYIGHEQVLGFFQRAWSYLKEPCASMYTKWLRAIRGYSFSAPSARPDRASMLDFWRCTFGASSMVVRWTFKNFKVTKLQRATFGLNPRGPPMDLANKYRQEVRHLIAYCLNDACRHQAIIYVSRYPPETRMAKYGNCGSGGA